MVSMTCLLFISEPGSEDSARLFQVFSDLIYETDEFDENDSSGVDS